MIYRLKRDTDPDPSHELGEPVTIARRAAKYLERDHAPITIELYDHLDAAVFLRIMLRTPGLGRATIVIHGSDTPDAIAAHYCAPLDLVDEAGT